MNRRRVIFLGLAFLAPLSIAYLIFTYGVNVPYWDQWELVPLLEKLHSGKLSVSDLWVQHNEHRLFFPRIIMLALSFLTNWNIKFEFYTNLVLAGLTLFLLYRLLCKSIGNHLSPWFLVIFSFIVFSPIQWENWTWGWTIQIYLSVLTTVAAIWAINKWSGQLKGLILAMIFAIIASYSFGSGLLTWVVLIVLSIQKQRPWKETITLASAFVAIIWLYFYGYIKPAHHPSLFYPILHPYYFIRYILAYIGSPLGYGNGKNLSIIIGFSLVTLVCAAIIHLKRHSKEELDKLSPWLALALYAFLSACMIGIGRTGFGVRQAISSRYTTISSLFIISAFVIVTLWIKSYSRIRGASSKKIAHLSKFFFVSLIIAYAVSYLHGINQMAQRSKKLQKAASYLEDIKRAPDECLEILYPNATVVRQRIRILRELRLSIFFQDTTKTKLVQKNKS